VLLFEQAYSPRDPKYGLPAGKTFAQELKKRFLAAIASSRADVPVIAPHPMGKSPAHPGLFDSEGHTEPDAEIAADAPEDVLATYQSAAIARVAGDKQFIDRIHGNGIPWAGLVEALEKALPAVLDDRNKIAYELVPQFLNQTFGERGKGWDSEKRPKKSGSGMTTWVVLK
jgi:hypothetical protein